jgi:4-hydroxybenzoate polyprenyltransferase
MNLSPRSLAYLRLLRLPAAFTAISNSLAAQLIATGGQLRWPELGLLVMASTALYLAGMVLNDCFDLTEDRRDRPQRPLPSGAVSIAIAWRLGWLLLGAGVALAGFVGLRTGAIALVLALAIVLYDGFLKATAVGWLMMGACRYLNWLLGLAVVPLTPTAFLWGLPIFAYVVALTLLSRVETSAASRWPVLLCAAGMVAVALLLASYQQFGLLPHAGVLVLVAAGLGLALSRLWATWREFTPTAIQRSVGWLVLGIIPLDAVMAWAAGPWWGGLLVLALLVPGRLLGRWLYVA